MSTNLPFVPVSQRVRSLSAVCIQALVRRKYGLDISLSDALQLASAHDLRSVLVQLGRKLEVHRESPRDVRIRIAAAEAAIGQSGTVNDQYVHTVLLRQSTVETMSNNVLAGHSREALLARLRSLRRSAEEWAKEYADFIKRLAALHSKATRELSALHLDPNIAARAEQELEEIIVRAHKKAGEIESSIRVNA